MAAEAWHLKTRLMVTTVSSYTEARNRALIGDGYDGVVRVVFSYLYDRPQEPMRQRWLKACVCLCS